MLINDKNLGLVDNYVSNFIGTLKYKCNYEKNLSAEVLLYISEILGTVYEDSSLINFSNSIISEHVKLLESYSLLISGMFSEYGIFAYSINEIYLKTGELRKINTKLNEILLDFTCINLRKDVNKIRSRDFDCINGVAGVLNYILYTDISKLNKNKIEKLIDYEIWLTKKHFYKDKNLPNFYIMQSMLPTEEDKKNYKNGYINFSISHGIMGILISLIKAYERGFDSKEILDTIKYLYKLYKEYELVNKLDILYPTKMSIDDYINKNLASNFPINFSWCYGNISIILSMLKASKFLGYKNDYLFYKRYLINMFNKDIENYNLVSVSLCHGYASVISEQIYAYKEEEILAC